jgi:hypothetical protein
MSLDTACLISICPFLTLGSDLSNRKFERAKIRPKKVVSLALKLNAKLNFVSY